MIAIRFDGPPSGQSGRFVEVEVDGKSVRFGQWVQDGPDWLLVLPEPPLDSRLVLLGFLAGALFGTGMALAFR